MMKRFGKSIPGKVTIYVGLVIFMTVLVVCAVGAGISYEYGFFTKSKKELEKSILESYAYQKAYDYDHAAFAKQLANSKINPKEKHDLTDVMIFEDASVFIMEGLEVYSYNSSYYGFSEDKNCVNFVFWADNIVSTFANDYWVQILPNNSTVYKGTNKHHRVKINVYINTEKITDLYVRTSYKLVTYAYGLRYAVFFIGAGALLIVVFLFVTLMWAAGRRSFDDEIHPALFEKVPFDIICGVALVILAGMVYISDKMPGIGELIGFAITAFVAICMIPGLSMGFALRIKRQTLIKNTVIYKIVHLVYRAIKFLVVNTYKLFKKVILGIGRAFGDKSITIKAVVIIGGITLIELAYLLYSMDSVHKTHLVFMGFIIEKLILVPACFYVIVMFRRLQKSGEMLAAGELSYVTDTSKLVGDFKKHGENLNNISIGMSKSVQNSIKSERMKTELITNVSHDIKTPLTSIINYATLIAGERTDNPRINEYSEVLVRQSDKLKRLIEDLVEASKASTGNMEVNLEPCDAGVFIAQVSGEFEDKIGESNLKMITSVPDSEVRILADSRRLWRVFDNLLNNICKYGMPGSRVYISLNTDGNNAVFVLKNTSKTELNISADELMERFVRGDSSRNTEGNGLGLSIAKSLVELQKGTMDIEIDGDLFKIKITFPIM